MFRYSGTTMSHRRTDVVEHALEVLDRHGLADLSMRRLAADLDVRPSALYWHFANKQTLLAAVADEVLRRGERPVPDGPWDDRVTACAHQLRDAMLAYRDGAELVATALAFGLGEADPAGRLASLIETPDDRLARVNGVQVACDDMSHRRSDVVEHALSVLDRYGLADLSMRRLAADLDVRPSALYWHFANKQTLLAAVADEVLRRGERPVPDGPWADRVTAYAHQLRDAMLAYRDGAELVATALAFGLGEADPAGRLASLIEAHDDRLAGVAASTIMHFVLGHVSHEQMNMQAGSAGALNDDPLRRDDTFSVGLAMIVDGIRAQDFAIRTPL